ncbi:PREDICTED: bifunctional transcriptional activator/DNA repair enzyme Ada [Dinoponera quadriceps]|uniref:methylated-DNA--[protein]-cysteine S-methyltransferase n=1 Tax=Dinoponera quadriceps TaxID=609295 RepID=A0A6P3YF89_DINQU|nr:PREDICTED: bifunctional transcriptional activator/DNA repair enzyme Ada [Dinoponera quadriceps]
MVKFRSMTSDEYKMDQSTFRLLYAFYPTPFGKCLIAITDMDKAVVYFGFVDGVEERALKILQNEWPLSQLSEDTGRETKSIIEKVFQSDEASLDSLCVLLRGTLFQVQVWKSLMTIPKGECITYEEVAKTIDNPKAIRPVGNAISKNRVAYIVPCHRVTNKKADSDKYAWGVERKQAILRYERGLVVGDVVGDCEDHAVV